MFVILQAEPEKAVLHCAAGIHRTGTIGYTLMRLSKRSESESMQALKSMREETFKGVGAWRIELAENLLVKFILVNDVTMNIIQEDESADEKE